ncbi:hypothetical protein OA527_00600 [Pelagibacteraceae bacterium]|nr:hypothetical protein [Pelagibacteraceae bacterium]
MLPAHYAITELLIVIAAYFSINNLFNDKNYFAGVGVFLIGLTALIGAIRFGIFSSDLIVYVNKILALFSGILALSLVSIQIISNNISKKIAGITLAVSAVTFLSLFIWTQPILKLSILFTWAIFSIILTFSLPQKSLLMKLFKAFLMSIILIAFITLSKQLGIFTKSLSPSLSFHLYHILIATWVILVNYTISQNNTFKS